MTTSVGIGHFSAVDSESEGDSRYHALVTPVPFTDVRFVLPYDHRMYVADADSVHVINDQGDIERSITGLPGAEGLVANADTNTLYVAESAASRVVAIDLTTGEVTVTYDVAPCPHHLAIIGTLLFYTAGCDSSGSIGHIDLGTGAVSLAADQSLSQGDALLAATSDTLFVADDRLRSWTMSSLDGVPTYGSESDGSYFPHVLSLTPHGDDVVLIDSGINGYGLYRSDLGADGFIDTVSFPTAVAWSSDGTHLAGGSDTPRGSAIRVLSSVDYSVGVRASIPSLKGLEGNQAVVAGALMYSSDESVLVALARECVGSVCTYAIARASTSTPLPSSVTVHVSPPTAYGRPSHIEVHSPGRPNVRVLVTATNGSWHASRDIMTNSAGVGSVDLVLPFSAVVTAHLSGDLGHEDASPVSASVRVPSAFTVTLGRGAYLLRGLLHYSKLSDMRQHVLLSPRMKSRMVSVTLMYHVGAKWLSTKPFTIYTDSNGYVNTVMKQARRSIAYRIKYSFAGDAWNTGTSRTSGAFVLN
jgi:DNA-binding beta-propeller fold protein YncE